jgi:hypothetical protein
MHVGVEIGFEIVMRRHLVDLAAFFVEAQPPAFAVGEVIFDAHADRCADAGEAEGHQRDQRAVAQADDGRDVDAVEQLARLRGRQHGSLAALDGVLRPAQRVGGIDGEDLPDDEIVEQHSDRGEMLLDGRLFELARHRLDIGPDMNRLDRGPVVETGGVAPGDVPVRERGRGRRRYRSRFDSRKAIMNLM